MNKIIKTLFFTSLLIITMESVVAGKVFSKNSVQFKSIIKQLSLNTKKIKKDLLVFKIKPNNPSETIVVIPEIVKENEYLLELNSYMLDSTYKCNFSSSA